MPQRLIMAHALHRSGNSLLINNPPRPKVRFHAEPLGDTVCAVAGLSKTFPGQGLGMEAASAPPELEPVLNYQLLLPEGMDPHVALDKLRLLAEEDPQLPTAHTVPAGASSSILHFAPE